MTDFNFTLTAKLDGYSEARTRIRLMSESFTAAPPLISRAAAEIIKEALKKNTPRGRAGQHDPNLEESIDFIMDGSRARFHGNSYAKFVIEGHAEIWAGIYTGKSPKRFLRFEIDGEEIFTSHVKATKGDDFRIPAMAEARPEVEALMHEAGVRTIRGELV